MKNTTVEKLQIGEHHRRKFLDSAPVLILAAAIELLGTRVVPAIKDETSNY